jgi:hypothetical protein
MHEAELLGVKRGDGLAEQQHARRKRRTGQPREALRAAPAGQPTGVELGEREARIECGEADVGGERELEADRAHGAAEHGDGRHSQRSDRLGGVQPAAKRVEVRGDPGAEVGAGAAEREHAQLV